MAIDTQDPISQDDSSTALWAVVTIAILAILSYAGYAAYHYGNNTTNVSPSTAVTSNPTPNDTPTPNTPTPNVTPTTPNQ